MSEAKHTPGPWRMECGDDPESWADYFPVVLAEGYCVIGSEGMYGDRNVDIANAHLIAAAPELLEALQDAEKIDDLHRRMHRIEQRRPRGSFGIAVSDDDDAIEWRNFENEAAALIIKRNAAIAKATGQPHD